MRPRLRQIACGRLRKRVSVPVSFSARCNGGAMSLGLVNYSSSESEGEGPAHAGDKRARERQADVPAAAAAAADAKVPAPAAKVTKPAEGRRFLPDLSPPRERVLGGDDADDTAQRSTPTGTPRILLPPQLRGRKNVVTEDSDNWNTRRKTATPPTAKQA